MGPVYLGARQLIDYNIGDYTLRRPKFRQLYCRTGYHLVIKTDGTVRGTREQYNAYSKFGTLNFGLFYVYFVGIMEFMTVAVAVVAIRSVHTGLYLSISSHGDLIGTVIFLLRLLISYFIVVLLFFNLFNYFIYFLFLEVLFCENFFSLIIWKILLVFSRTLLKFSNIYSFCVLWFI